ncbi:MAG TPA: DUF4350 domain-containing protein [Pirellulales bacterium]|nr:DUF4350 domain-containing protein [Pirellulales bacterium]
MPLALTGCENGIDSTYGRRSGAMGGNSVNGTAVLAEMFEQAGHRVAKTSWLTPRVRAKADVIVWAPDDFEHPSDEVCEWFDDWWQEKPGRVLIYIGRDYDAAPAYWNAVQAGAPQDQLREIKRRLAESQVAFRDARSAIPDKEEGEWFTIEGQRRRRDVRTLDGPWSAGVVPTQLEVELNGRIVPATGAKPRLSSDGDVLVSRREINGGSLIVVANGSFLLNEPLVRHEHRKLAARLIAEINPRQQVVFLESGAGGPPVLDKEPEGVMQSGLEFLGKPPFNWIFLQLAVLGLVFCVTRFPIFGTPRPLDPAPLSDFGRHIWALGKLLERTGDRAYAMSRLQHYQQHVRREPGRYRRGAGTDCGSRIADCGLKPIAERPDAETGPEAKTQIPNTTDHGPLATDN